jgi:exonuclease VII large subunit
MLAEHLSTLAGYEKALARSRWRVPGTRDLGGVLARLIAAATRARRRWEADRGALQEATAAADRVFVRRLGNAERDLSAVSCDMGLAARRRLAQAQQSTAHVAAVIAARDFRRSGWVLAGDARGAPVRSVGDLRTGAELSLRFDDGVADAVVTDVHRLGGGGHG